MSEAMEQHGAVSRHRFKPYPAYKDSGVEWLGEIPAHWELTRIRHAVRSIQNGTTADQLSFGESDYRVTRIETISNGVIDLEKVGFVRYSSELERYRLKSGDVLLSHINSLPMIGNCALYDLDTPLFGGMNLLRLRPNSDVSGSWLWNWLRSSLVRQSIRARAKPSINQASVPSGSIKDLPLCVPPGREEQAIRSFLDRETARIDALVAKNERLIELLQEKRTALITRAVTKGLDPNVPMKDSGVEWLGGIPAHWEVKKVKRLCLVRRGASPRPIDDPIYFDEEGEYAWVRIADVTASERYLERTTQRLSTIGKSKSVALEPGELFVSIAATVGKPVITKIKCCIHDGFVYFVGLHENREFLFYLFSCGEPYKGLGKLGTQLNLNTDTIGDIYLPRPSGAEQEAIVQFLDRETAKIDALVDKVREAIERLKELRTALISAAVTGKIDVREHAA